MHAIDALGTTPSRALAVVGAAACSIDQQAPQRAGRAPASFTTCDVDATQNGFIRQLFVRHGEALRGYIRRRVGNEADVSELVQEVYVRLMHRKSAERLREAPESYLFRTALNLIRDRHRRNASRYADRHIPFQDWLVKDSGSDPESVLASSQLSSILEQAARELSPKTRRVFLLRHVHGLSYRQIESTTGIPIRSVERYISQAIAHCRLRVGKQL